MVQKNARVRTKCGVIETKWQRLGGCTQLNEVRKIVVVVLEVGMWEGQSHVRRWADERVA